MIVTGNMYVGKHRTEPRALCRLCTCLPLSYTGSLLPEGMVSCVVSGWGQFLNYVLVSLFPDII